MLSGFIEVRNSNVLALGSDNSVNLRGIELCSTAGIRAHIECGTISSRGHPGKEYKILVTRLRCFWSGRFPSPRVYA